MTPNEQSMRFLEEHIPDMAAPAFTQAYWQSLASGNSVLESENGVIYEAHPDGTRTIVKTTEPPTALPHGAQRVIP